MISTPTILRKYFFTQFELSCLGENASRISSIASEYINVWRTSNEDVYSSFMANLHVGQKHGQTKKVLWNDTSRHNVTGLSARKQD